MDVLITVGFVVIITVLILLISIDAVRTRTRTANAVIKQGISTAEEAAIIEISVRASIECLLQAERERCASIADEYADDPHGSNPSCSTGEAIAQKIRSGE